MEPITIAIFSYSLTLTLTITTAYYISNKVGHSIYGEIGKLRSKSHIFI
jgi:hypothetical protein